MSGGGKNGGLVAAERGRLAPPDRAVPCRDLDDGGRKRGEHPAMRHDVAVVLGWDGDRKAAELNQLHCEPPRLMIVDNKPWRVRSPEAKRNWSIFLRRRVAVRP